eukprot:5279457-Pyramimonas_sp.AAC.1
MSRALILADNKPGSTGSTLLSHTRHKMGEHPERTPRRSVTPRLGHFNWKGQSFDSRMPVLAWRQPDPVRPAHRFRGAEY